MNDLAVFISHQEATCVECKETLGVHAWITLQEQKGAVCLSCSDLDHLVFLPAGDTALTRRSRKNSRLSAVVLEWSRARKRYERQGVLVEENALEQAEKECMADEVSRAAARQRAAERREELDERYIQTFAQKIRQAFPGCPAGREEEIARHACRKYSGRVGRAAFAKAFDPTAVKLAVSAHIRHVETGYDDLLIKGHERHAARLQVDGTVSQILLQWEKA
jgi:hypothetical protein